ncbi:GNAT family N-acetyltransferase [Glutamicibacter sp. X7]
MRINRFTDTEMAQDFGRTLLSDSVVTLRELQEQDLPLLAAWWNDPEWAVLQQRTVKPRPERPVTEMFADWSVNRPGDANCGFSIVTAQNSQLIGHITLYGANFMHRAAECSILIGPEFTGRGYGPKALALILGYGFRELGLHRVGVKVHAYNRRAVRAYLKAGFVHEGTERESIFRNGRFYDMLSLSMLSSDYFAGLAQTE